MIGLFINGQRRTLAAALAGSGALLLGLASPLIMHPVQAEKHNSTEEFVNYASPLELLFSPDGARLYVLCQQSQEVRVLDASTFAPIKKIAVGGVPRGMSLSTKGDRLYVTNSWDDTLSVIDTAALAVVGTWHVGSEPSGVVADATSTRLSSMNIAAIQKEV